MTKTLSASALQTDLATQSPDTEINLATLATTMQDNNLQEAVTFFSTFPESKKVQYLTFLHNYYYYLLTGGSYMFAPTEAFSDEFIVEIEDSFINKLNLDTTQLVPLRRLVSRLQREVAKQRQYKKEEVAV